MLSVVVPVYGCDACLSELTQRLFTVGDALGTPMEIVLVNDASPDHSWDCIRRLAEADDRIKGVNLSRNFGQHFAITAGLHYASGDQVAVMDCDLQDIPEELPKLYQPVYDGAFDAAFGRRVVRQDYWLKKLKSRTFFRLLSFLAGTPIDPTIANFSVISAPVVKALRQMDELHRSYGMLVSLATSRIAHVDLEHGKRAHGESSYTLTKQLRLAADLVISHSIRPLYFSAFAGFTIAGIGFLAIAYLVVRYFANGIPVAGWASTIASIWLVGGLLMVNLGVMGLYLGKVLEQVKRRPLFLSFETLNLCNNSTANNNGSCKPPLPIIATCQADNKNKSDA